MIINENQWWWGGCIGFSESSQTSIAQCKLALVQDFFFVVDHFSGAEEQLMILHDGDFAYGMVRIKHGGGSLMHPHVTHELGRAVALIIGAGHM